MTRTEANRLIAEFERMLEPFVDDTTNIAAEYLHEFLAEMSADTDKIHEAFAEGERSVSNRTEIIRQLLDRYHELVDPLNGGSGVPGDGDSVNLMPRTYSASVKELERLLKRMRDDRVESLVLIAPGTKCSVRSLWWHLNARFIAAGTRTVDRQVTQRGKNGKRLTLTVRQVEAVYDRGVDPRKVDAGIQYLASNWGLAQEPFLPSELLVAA